MYIKENTTKKWHGIYKGVNFEINNWTREYDGYDCWTYYLVLYLERMPKDKRDCFWLKGIKTDLSSIKTRYDYYGQPILNELDFHGGITWYSKEAGFDFDERVVKIGCDYSHIWDERHSYNLETIKSDVINTIEDFRKKVDYKYRCSGNGKLYNESEGIVKEGSFYSDEYRAK